MKKHVGVLITVLLLLNSVSVFSQANGLKYGSKPDYSQSKLDSDLLEVYNKWKGDAVIEDVASAKPIGDGYLAKYNAAGSNKPIYIIKGDATGSAEEWNIHNDSSLKIASTSEATGYGMIVFALMANKDPKAHEYFDGLLNLYLRNLSSTVINGRTLNTMSWMVPNKYTTTGGVQPVRSGSACDGDMDIAYALLLADKKWGSTSSYANTSKTYRELAEALIADIRDFIISSDTNRVLMGDSYFGATDGTSSSTTLAGKFNHSSTRPSDWMVSHLKAFQSVVPSPKWGNAINEIYRILPLVSGDTTGLAPDFVEDISGVASPGNKSITATLYTDGGDEYTAKVYMEHWKDDMYGQNACRVPWRIATDYAHYGTSEAKAVLTKLNNWSSTLPSRIIRGGSGNGWDSSHDNDWWTNSQWYDTVTFPRNIASGYTLDGDPIWKKYTYKGVSTTNNNWNRVDPWVDVQFAAPIGFANIVNGGSSVNLKATWDYAVSSFSGDHTAEAGGGYTCYFGDSINLLNMLLVSGNWKNPAIGHNYKNESTGRWYDDMQDAINSASSGHTIRIYRVGTDARNNFIRVDSKNNLTIETVPGAPDIKVTVGGRYGVGISIVNSTNITIRNIDVSGYGIGMGISNSSSITVDSCNLHSGFLGNGLVFNNVTDLEVKNCKIWGGKSDAVRMYDRCDNVDFHHNVVFGSPVMNSVCAIRFQGYSSNGKSLNFYNNVIRGGYYGIYINSETVTNIKNNIFTDIPGSNVPTKDYDIRIHPTATSSIDYNLYPDNIKTVYGATAGSNKVTGDPMFVSPNTNWWDSNGDYNLKTGSPARDKGVAISGITTNVSDGKPDIGAFEAVRTDGRSTSYSYSFEYKAGDKVDWSGKRYIAKWDTKNNTPGAVAYPISPWEEIGDPVTVFRDTFDWGTGSWYNYYDPSAYSIMYNENGMLRTDIYNGGINAWDVQLGKEVSFIKGNYYTVMFEAKTEQAVTIQVVACMGDAPYTPYSLYEEIDLTSGKKEYSFTFRMDHPTDYNGILEFDIGGEETPQDIWIDNIRIIKE